MILQLFRLKAAKMCWSIHARICPLTTYISTREELERRFQAALSSSFNSIVAEEVKVGVSQSKMGYGDYQCNIALMLARVAKKSPIEVANRVIEALDRSDLITALTVTGPGFINIRLSERYLLRRLRVMLSDRATGRLGFPAVSNAQSKKIVVDFSSPNIAKEMHVGHLRSTIIGDCICHALEFAGHDVLRLNHVGDWGTQFGMLIHYLKLNHPELCTAILRPQKNADAPIADIGDINVLYKNARRAFEENLNNFQDCSRAEVVALQNCHLDSLEFWKFFCSLSRKEFEKNYELLGIEITERGESFYNPLLGELVNKLVASGHAVLSDGATVVFLHTTCSGTPILTNGDDDSNKAALVLQKSDGGYLYATTDLAALKYRLQTPNLSTAGVKRVEVNGVWFACPNGGDGADMVIYVTDSGQSLYFERLFAVANHCGIVQERNVVKHVPFGVVLGEDGKKIKSRSGDTVRLSDLIRDAVIHAGDVLRSRSDSQLSSIEERAHRLGIASVKYADLSVKREGEYRFSPQKMTSMSGNTAPYLLYVLVRIRSIKRKIGNNSHLEHDKGEFNLLAELELFPVERNIKLNAHERALVSKLISFDEVMQTFLIDFYPHKICDYVYELCQLFNTFYEECPIIGAESICVGVLRAWLCVLTEDVLCLYLGILGIETVEEM